jgi:RNA polymerase sigma-70 factor, ECF subfamily
MDALTHDVEIQEAETEAGAYPGRRDTLLQEALKYQTYLRNFIRSRFPHLTMEDAEDVTQEVFVILSRKIDQFRGDAQLKTWLVRVAWNAARAYSKKQYSHQSEWSAMPDDVSDEMNEAHASATEAPAIADETRESVWECLRGLSADEFDVVFLADIRGMRNQEAADVLELSLPALKTRLHRARLHLRELMEHRHLDLAS